MELAEDRTVASSEISGGKSTEAMESPGGSWVDN